MAHFEESYKLSDQKQAYVIMWGENKSPVENCPVRKDAETIRALLQELGFTVPGVCGNLSAEELQSWVNRAVIPEAEKSSCLFMYFIINEHKEEFLDHKSHTLELFMIWEKFFELTIPKIFIIQANMVDHLEYAPTRLFNRSKYSPSPIEILTDSTHNLLAYLPNISGAKRSVPDILNTELRKNLDINSALTSVIQIMQSINPEITPKFGSTLIKLLYLRDMSLNLNKDESQSYNISDGKKCLVYAFLFEKFQLFPDLISDREILKEAFEKINCTAEFSGISGIVTTSCFNQNLRNYLQDEEKLKETECIMIIISTHGLENGRLASFDGEFSLDDVWTLLANCDALVGKPKVIIIDACRGCDVEVDRESEKQRQKRADVSTMKKFIIQDPSQGNDAKMRDILIVSSSTEGARSFQNHKGSFFLQNFTQAVKECEGKICILKFLNTVMRAMEEGDKIPYSHLSPVCLRATFTSTLGKILEIQLNSKVTVSRQ